MTDADAEPTTARALIGPARAALAAAFQDGAVSVAIVYETKDGRRHVRSVPGTMATKRGLLLGFPLNED